MINKIKANKNLIAKILCILAIALFVPEIIALFGQDFSNAVFSLILYSTATLSAVYILILLLTKKELTAKALIFPVALLFAGPLATYIRNMIDLNSWSYPYYIALYGAAIAMYVIMAFCDKKEIKYVVFMLFLIILTLNLLSVFGGSSVGAGRLIIGLIIIGNVYLNLDKGEEKENETI